MTDLAELRVRRPAEGWITLALVAGLGLILAWALDDPAYVNGRGALTDCLPIFALCGVAIGFAGPKLGWGRWTTHLMGAVFAALLIPVFAGWAARPDTSVGQAFWFVANGTINAYLDLAWRGLRLTTQEIHYTVVLGILVWGTMQFASYAVFGHRRPLAAVVVMGVVLVGNMAVTLRDQLSFLIAFTAGSLFLLIQMHAFDERATWIRRRIGDPSTISTLYLRGGTVFIVAAMVVSMLLTTRASSAPLAGAWGGINDRLIELGDDISRWLPVGGAYRPLGKLSFGSTARISPVWYSDDRVAFTAAIPEAFQEERWRAATYDKFELGGWTQTRDATARYPVEAGERLLEDTPEDPNASLTTELAVTVVPAEYRESLLLVPGSPLTVDRPADVILFGTRQWFAGVALRSGEGAYAADAAVLRIEDDDPTTEDGITQNKLRAAGTRYDEELIAAYTDVPAGSMGPAATQLLEDILGVARSTNPFDLAKAMEAYLHSDRFQYDTNVTDVDCDDPSQVECFAESRKGTCLHFASTMAILLRQAVPGQPIPTRLVQGFLPGEASGNQTTVRIRDAHAWVEVYFPGYGWIPFDPTGQVGIPTALPVGAPVAPASLVPLPSGRPEPPDPALGPGAENQGDLPPGPTAGGGGPVDRGVLAVIAIVMGLTVFALAFAVWLRGPRGEVSPDAAWKAMTRTASRLGYAQRPTQTVYEYASTLGDLVPVAERDIGVVATAKVETAYAGVRLAGARLDDVRDATRRLRVSLLRLMFRRPGRRRRSR